MSYDGGAVNFTVPAGVRVLKVDNAHHGVVTYVGVTPGSVHNLKVTASRSGVFRNYRLACMTHNKGYNNVNGQCFNEDHHFFISWSPEINTHTPNNTDY